MSLIAGFTRFRMLTLCFCGLASYKISSVGRIASLGAIFNIPLFNQAYVAGLH